MPTVSDVREQQRLAALRRYQILDTEVEPAFDNLALLAAQVCGTHASIICFVDETRSWTKAGHNNTMVEVDRDESVATRVVMLREPLVVPDAREAPPDIRSLKAVAHCGVRFFAAVPLVTPDGHAIGAMGVFDGEPRQLTGDQLRALDRLGQQVMAQLELRRGAYVLSHVNRRLRRETAERRAAEAALAESERRFRTLVEYGSDILTIIEPSGTVAFASPSVGRVVGYSADDLTGMNVFSLVHPDDVQQVQSVFERRLSEAGVGTPSLFRFRARDGSWRYLEATGTNPGADAAVSGLIVVARDVTERVQAEEALRRREAILAAVSRFAEQLLRERSWRSAIGEALGTLGQAAGVTRVYMCERRRADDGPESFVVEHEWIADGHEAHGRRVMQRGVSLAGVGLGRWMGLLEAGEVVQGNAADFPAAEQAVLSVLALKSVAVVPVKLGDDWWGFVGFGECRGEREWSAAELDALRAAGNTLGAAIQRQQMEGKLEATVQELARSNAELEQFAYVASHDLQEPLRMVQSYLGLVQRRYQGRLDVSAEEFIAYALDGAERMRHLIRDLLAISRVDTQGREPAPTDTGRVLNRVLRDLGEALREDGAEVTLDEMPVVLADESQLAQVFQNLVSNAVKFRSEQPCRVHIGAARDNGEWRFSVRDNGIGVPMQHADRIFAPFQRLHSRSEYPGTGIGLALCKKIVERHGGRIWVESQPGEQTTFWFTIPEPAAPAA